ncbi:MAG: YrbL family protein [Verrucomicrobiota bacterium]
MIHLDETLLLGEGGDKFCYSHPFDKTRCIKIVKSDASAQKNIQIELRAYALLQKRKIAAPYLSSYFGTLDTNLGLGYVFEYIASFIGGLEELKPEELKERILDLYQKCLIDSVVLRDLSIGNLRLDASRNIKIIDGLGAREFFPICYWSRFFARQKIRRKFAELIDGLREKTNEWTQPLRKGNAS